MNRPQYVHGARPRRIPARSELVAKYYSMLSDVYGMKHDEKKRAWAPNMSIHYEAVAEQLRKRE